MISRQRSAGTWAMVRSVPFRVGWPTARPRPAAARLAPAKKAAVASACPRACPCRRRTGSRGAARDAGWRVAASETITSPTSVRAASGPISPGSPSPARMPTVDAFTIMSTWPAARDGRPKSAGREGLPERSVSACARSPAGSMSAIDCTLRPTSAQAIALPAPPAPNSTTRRPSQRSPLRSPPRTKPAPSNMSPSTCRRPRAAAHSPRRCIVAVSPTRARERQHPRLVRHGDQQAVEVAERHQRRHDRIEGRPAAPAPARMTALMPARRSAR